VRTIRVIDNLVWCCRGQHLRVFTRLNRREPVRVTPETSLIASLRGKSACNVCALAMNNSTALRSNKLSDASRSDLFQIVDRRLTPFLPSRASPAGREPLEVQRASRTYSWSSKLSSNRQPRLDLLEMVVIRHLL
jgi:hypothetical protein